MPRSCRRATSASQPRHVAVEVELVAVVDADQRVGVPEHDAVEPAVVARRSSRNASTVNRWRSWSNSRSSHSQICATLYALRAQRVVVALVDGAVVRRAARGPRRARPRGRRARRASRRGRRGRRRSWRCRRQSGSIAPPGGSTVGRSIARGTSGSKSLVFSSSGRTGGGGRSRRRESAGRAEMMNLLESGDGRDGAGPLHGERCRGRGEFGARTSVAKVGCPDRPTSSSATRAPQKVSPAPVVSTARDRDARRRRRRLARHADEGTARAERDDHREPERAEHRGELLFVGLRAEAHRCTSAARCAASCSFTTSTSTECEQLARQRADRARHSARRSCPAARATAAACATVSSRGLQLQEQDVAPAMTSRSRRREDRAGDRFAPESTTIAFSPSSSTVITAVPVGASTRRRCRRTPAADEAGRRGGRRRRPCPARR